MSNYNLYLCIGKNNRFARVRNIIKPYKTMKISILKFRTYLRRITCIVYISLSVIQSFAQIDSTEIYLERSENLFNEKNYSAVISEANKGLSLYGNREKDITYVHLLQLKSLAYNWMDDNRSAMPLYKEAIITYCDLKGEYGLPCNMSKAFISIYTRSGYESYSDSVFVFCLHNIFRNNCISNLDKNDLLYYIYYNGALTGWYSYGYDLEAEQKVVKEIGEPILMEYVNYAKGYREIHGHNGFGSTKKGIRNGISILEQTENRIKSVDIPAAKYLLYNIYTSIAYAANSLGEYEMASNNYKKSFELSKVHWQQWKHKDLWKQWIHTDSWENLSPCIDAMKNANMNSEIITCCEQVISDSLSSKKHKELALKSQQEAYISLGIEKGSEKNDSKSNESFGLTKGNKKTMKELDADSILLLYDNSQLSQQIIDTITSFHFIEYNSIDYRMIYSHLLEQGDYETLTQIASKVYYSLYDNAETFAEYTVLDYEEMGIDYEKLSKNDKQTLVFWDLWRFANWDELAWTTCHYLALACFYTNDFENAILYQKKAFDIVRLENVFYPNGRKKIIESGYIEDENYTSAMYLDTEQDMIDWLAFFYLKSKDYENANMYYREKLNIVIEILEDQLIYGAKSVKNKTWEDWNRCIYEIIYSTIDYTEEYPPFGDLILECNSLIKGFMLNIHTETYDAVKTSTSSVSGIYTRSEQLKKVLEESYYNNGNDFLSLSEQIGRLNIELNDAIDFSDIIRNAGQDMSSVESNLDDGDVLIDICALLDNNVDKVEKTFGKPFDSIVDGQTVQFIRVRSYPNPTFYATIVRKGWEHPKVIKLGNIASASIDDAGRDLLDCVYQQLDYDKDINRLYRSTTFGDLIWGKIIETGNINKGENIYFCPTSYLNDVAIEYLLVGSDGIMSEQYNMYRISTIRELNKPETVFKKGDQCVAFGDINYTQNKSLKKKSKEFQIKGIDMTSSPEAMFNRNELDELEPTQGILQTISKTIPKTKVINGMEATEESFGNLSGNSPELLVIATHGYNYEREELNKEYEDYLYGNRDITLLSEQEQSMYKSGLFMAQSSNNIPTNGMLTAKEISMCDLHNTKLAIVAACVSAVGSNTDEGVFGIQRGMKMAGVQSLLVSLWNVNVEATQLLMEEFVRQYVKGVSPREALRKAQQYVRDYEDMDLIGDKHKFRSPYNWAGFILID